MKQMIRDKRLKLFVVMATVVAQTVTAQTETGAAGEMDAVQKRALCRLEVTIVSVHSKDAYRNPKVGLDGDSTTEFIFVWSNGGAMVERNWSLSRGLGDVFLQKNLICTLLYTAHLMLSGRDEAYRDGLSRGAEATAGGAFGPVE